jgi:hypothetical protein
MPQKACPRPDCGQNRYGTGAEQPPEAIGRGTPKARIPQAASPRQGLAARIPYPLPHFLHPWRLPESRLHGCKLSDYLASESHPCALDTCNPCRYDVYSKGC